MSHKLKHEFVRDKDFPGFSERVRVSPFQPTISRELPPAGVAPLPRDDDR
jgi:hypothetical protein